MRPRILVINPNSNESVTDGLRRSLASYRDVTDIDCCTLSDGPFGIESDDDVAVAAGLVIDRVASANDYDACVIACYSDPGLAECRARFDKPVFGMQQSALEAAALVGRFGVLALSDESIARHLVYIDRLGLGERLAGELPLDISVDQSANDPAAMDRIVKMGQRLIDELGAEVVILGCAGMTAHKKPAAEALRVPVIEPVEAAVEAALAAII
jgi:allantoin racemase